MDGGGSEVPDHKPVGGVPARKPTVMASAEGKSDAKAKLLFKRPEARSFNCLAVVEWCGGKAGGMTYNLDEVKAKIKASDTGYKILIIATTMLILMTIIAYSG
eukprot:jgi/Bigna1/128070/aug1.5_g2778